MEAFTIRQADIIPADCLKYKVTIVGAGAIGSHTAISLARMGMKKLTIIDDDIVSAENMNSQGYDIDDIGKPKVNCLAAKIERATGIKVEKIMRRIDEYDALDADILISAVDSMKARQDILSAFIGGRGYFIDPRMGAEYAKLIVYNRASDPTDFYAKSWYSDEEALAEACTSKATIYCANLLSGLVVKAVKDIITDKPYTRSVEWDITNNKLIAWSNTKERL